MFSLKVRFEWVVQKSVWGFLRQRTGPRSGELYDRPVALFIDELLQGNVCSESILLGPMWSTREFLSSDEKHHRRGLQGSRRDTCGHRGMRYSNGHEVGLSVAKLNGFIHAVVLKAKGKRSGRTTLHGRLE